MLKIPKNQIRNKYNIAIVGFKIDPNFIKISLETLITNQYNIVNESYILIR